MNYWHHLFFPRSHLGWVEIQEYGNETCNYAKTSINSKCRLMIKDQPLLRLQRLVILALL